MYIPIPPAAIISLDRHFPCLSCQSLNERSLLYSHWIFIPFPDPYKDSPTPLLTLRIPGRDPLPPFVCSLGIPGHVHLRRICQWFNACVSLCGMETIKIPSPSAFLDPPPVNRFAKPSTPKKQQGHSRPTKASAADALNSSGGQRPKQSKSRNGKGLLRQDGQVVSEIRTHKN
jgi:hypothetical protein